MKFDMQTVIRMINGLSAKLSMAVLGLALFSGTMLFADTWEDSEGHIWSYTTSSYYDEEKQDWCSRTMVVGVQPIERDMQVPKYLSNTYWEYDESIGEYVEIGDNLVEVIGPGAFDGQTTLSCLYLPDSVTSISEYAFRGCTHLWKISGESVSSIGENAFEGCSWLDTVEFGEFGAAFIGDNAFIGCSALRSLTKCNDNSEHNVFCPVYVGGQAFMGCSLLNAELDMSCAGPEPWGRSAFEGCSSLVGSIKIPSEWDHVDDYLFNGCSSLSGVLILTSSLNSIGYYAFAGCSGLTGEFSLPSNLNYVGACAFLNCSGLTAEVVYIPSTISNLDWVFGGCGGLKSFEIPDTLISIGSNETFPKQSITYRDGFGYVDGWIVDCNEDLPNEVVVPGNVRGVADCAFDSATQMVSLVLPEGLKRAPKLAACKRLARLTLPESIEYVPYPSAFPDSVKQTVDGVCYVDNWALSLSNENLKHIVLRDGTRGIADSAFYFTGIESIRIPCSLKYICGWAFRGCTSMNALYIEDIRAWCQIEFADPYANPLSIGYEPSNVKLYVNGELVENLVIPEGVTRINSFAFYENQAMKGTLSLPSSLTNIGYCAFYDTRFTGVLTIPEGVIEVEAGAFSHCSGFVGKLSLPLSLQKIGSTAFCSCTGLSGDLVLPPDLVQIGGSAFYGDEGLNGTLTVPEVEFEMGSQVFSGTALSGHLTIPGGVKNVPAYAFTGLNFTALTLESGIEQIGDQAFCGCKILSEVSIPDTVTYIGNYAFSGCGNLTGNLHLPDKVESIGIGAFSSCSKLTGSLCIPDKVKSIGSWAFNGCSGFDGNLVLGEELESIGDSAFWGCSGFTGDINLPSTITNIGFNAFDKCSGLTGRLTIPGGVKVLHRSFYNTSFTSIIISDGVEVVDGSFASSMQMLEEISVPGTVKVIPDCFCWNATSLKRLTLGDGVEYIGHYAFRDCRSLSGTLMIPGSVNYIDATAFIGCSLDEVVFGEGIQEIPRVFNGMKTLRRVTLPSTTTSICAGAFEGSGLTEIQIPAGVVEIADNTFAGCSSLTEIVIPSGVLKIGDNAFSGCNSARRIIIQEGVTFIGTGAFNDCRSATEIVIPKSVISIASNAFSGCTGVNKPIVMIVSSGVREVDPTIMDVVYKVISPKPTAKVRALAFKDGLRDFRHIIRPETFVEGTEINVGDAITTGEEHKLSWKVSADLDAKLATVQMDVLAMTDDLLPLKLRTIPATSSHPDALQVSYTTMEDAAIIEAFYWLYADKDLGITVTDGMLKTGSTRMVYWYTDYRGNIVWVVSKYDSLSYIYPKMGFRLLQGAELDYAAYALHINFPPVDTAQYAVRTLSSGATH